MEDPGEGVTASAMARRCARDACCAMVLDGLGRPARALHDACDLRGLGAVDDDDAIHPRARQLPDSASSGTSKTMACPAPARDACARVASAIIGCRIAEPQALGGLCESECAHPGAIHRAVGGQHVGAECGGDGRERGAAGRGQRVGQGIGVDQQGAERGQAPRHRVLLPEPMPPVSPIFRPGLSA